MKKNKFRKILISFFILSFLILPLLPVNAANLSDWSAKLLETAGSGGAGYNVSQSDPIALVGTIIKLLLSLLGVIFLVLMMYGGFKWMTAQGNETNISEAKNLIRAAIIGIIIVAAAYAISYLACLVGVLLLPFFVFAGESNPLDVLKNFGGEAGYNQTNNNQGLGIIVGQVISAFLGLLGIIFVILIIYSGFKWMTAGGSPEDVKKAQDTIKRAIIGLIIIASAYAITYFVLSSLGGGGFPGGGEIMTL